MALPQLPNSSNSCLSLRASRHSTGTKCQEWKPLLSLSSTCMQGGAYRHVPGSCIGCTPLSLCFVQGLTAGGEWVCETKSGSMGLGTQIRYGWMRSANRGTWKSSWKMSLSPVNMLTRSSQLDGLTVSFGQTELCIRLLDGILSRGTDTSQSEITRVLNNEAFCQ